MLIFLRFAGLMNGAFWLGSVAFFAAGIWPLFSSPEMLHRIGGPLAAAFASIAGEVVAERFYRAQYWFAAVALIHLLLDWLYAGRVLRRGTLYLLLGLLGVSVIGGAVLLPKIRRAHLDEYGVRSTAAQRVQGRRSGALWQGTAQFMNLLVCGGLVVYVWQITAPGGSPRFVSAGKFRG